MKNCVKFFFVLTLTLTTPEALSSPSTDEMLVDTYLTDQGSKRMSQLVPQGRYSLTVKSALAPEALGAQVTLPFSRTPIVLEDPLARAPKTTELLVGRIKKLDVTLSVSKDVPIPVRELMKKTLEQQFRMNLQRGDVLTIVDLPGEFSALWEENPTDETQAPLWTPILAVISGIILAALALGGLLRSGFKNHSRDLEKSMREASENVQGAANAPALPQTSSFADSHKPQTQSSGTALTQLSSQEFWEGTEANIAHAFVVDLCESRVYGSMVSQLIHSEFPSELSLSVQSLLPKSLAEFPIDEESPFLDSGLIRSLFKKYCGEYKRLTIHAVGSTLFNLGNRQVLEVLKARSSAESLLILSQLSPIRKPDILRGLDANKKVELAIYSQGIKGDGSWTAQEAAVLSVLRSITTVYELVGAKSSIEQMRKTLLQPQTYEEDEIIFGQVQSQGASLPYASALLVTTTWTADDWNQQNLQQIALAYAGYSEGIRDAILAHFSDKKLQWLKTFFDQYSKRPLPITDSQVVAAQASFVHLAQALENPNPDHESIRQAA